MQNYSIENLNLFLKFSFLIKYFIKEKEMIIIS
jgi:hypothetical protein